MFTLITPDIASLKDEALNEAVAEHVMGWQRWATHRDAARTDPETRWFVEGRRWPTRTPAWSTEIGRAWDVVRHMRKMLFSQRQAFLLALQEQTAHKVEGTGEHVTIGWPDVLWFLTPETICRAAVAVCRSKAEGRPILPPGWRPSAPAFEWKPSVPEPEGEGVQ